ncbi:hypothetical protein Pla111_20420 [Botrimarina hoheduenensis]|uniref:Glycosyltransferase RgtA/B/C/D-like domain-containing protein n=1 Tax=Botrimarina hoheduenensis TaxID=2528000 RepID=A0A5C5W891_9BACT|nr:hypothetical protein Pla111_20420 [Botrimarina hoheduenensis]
MSLAADADSPGGLSKLDRARRDYRRLRRLLIALLIVACAGPLSLNLVDPDLWGHVRYGQDWIADGVLPRTASHTYTAEGYPWINHENLAELLFARGFATIGTPGMLIAKCLLGLAMLGMMWLAAQRQGVRPLATWALLLLVAHNLHAFFPMRPQLLSFLWCAAMLLIFDVAFAGWRNRRTDFVNVRRREDPSPIDWRALALLPPLMVVWANSHGGIVAGLAIGVTLLLGRAFELLVRCRRDALPDAAGLITVAILCLAATFATPYGVDLPRWLLHSLGTARPEITEWGPPLPGNPVFAPFVALVVLAIGTLLFTKRRRDPVQIAIMLLVGWQAVSHLRHIAFFALLCGFWLPPHLQSIAGRLRQQAAAGLPLATLTPRSRMIFSLALTLAIALQGGVVASRLLSLPVPRDHYPVDAIQWMADQETAGKLIVSFNWAQYAIAALAPDVRVSFDGRFRTCYPQAVIDRHFDFLLGDTWPRCRCAASGPIDPARTLEVDRPDYVLVDRRYDIAVGVMQAAAKPSAPDQSAPWTLLYQDAIAQVWGRSDWVNDPRSPQHVADEWRLVSDYCSPTAAPWPALPRDLGPLPSRATPGKVAAANPSNPQDAG